VKERVGDDEYFQNMMDAKEPDLEEQLAELGSMDRQLVAPSADEKRDALTEITRVESAITANIQEIKKTISTVQ
jgi:uncharacterized protein YecA (UPF0149 family)